MDGPRSAGHHVGYMCCFAAAAFLPWHADTLGQCCSYQWGQLLLLSE